jgi:hypothetical protein
LENNAEGINDYGLTFCRGSFAQMCTAPLFDREALHKRARLHFLPGKLCTNVHGSTFVGEALHKLAEADIK